VGPEEAAEIEEDGLAALQVEEVRSPFRLPLDPEVDSSRRRSGNEASSKSRKTLSGICTFRCFPSGGGIS
jgi:hypothetical protein